MTLRTFMRRLAGGKVNNFTYTHTSKEGLVSVWKHAGSFVLTWEECPKGSQYDESSYTRDERHTFATVEELLGFLATNKLTPESFTP
jgi:hypothetical protein